MTLIQAIVFPVAEIALHVAVWRNRKMDPAESVPSGFVKTWMLQMVFHK
jgi:hypothetical protein